MRRWWPIGPLVIAIALFGRAALLRRVAEADPVDRSNVPALNALAARIRPLHLVKTPPQPGEWLDKHQEDGQTFAAYLDEDPNRPGSERTTLYLQPIGEPDAVLLAKTATLLRRFYGLPVAMLDRIELDEFPASDRRIRPEWGDEQLITGPVLDRLMRDRPADAVAVLALTTMDLTPGEGWSFVFGQATLGERAGVWSVHRFGDPEADFPVVLRRTLQTAVHETGHMLGIRHCTAYECGMNGSNHLDEADGRPLGFCPECESKVWWACRVEPRERYRRLATFAEQNGLDRDAMLWRRSAEALDDRP